MDKLDFKNPSYNRETGETAWSMLYFGSYPQTEIKDNELASGITEAVYNEDGDALADGIKYRRIKQNGVFRYFRWDKIQWRVLWNDGKTLFVISDKGLDCKAYDNTDNFAIWEQSSLREWLAGSFYNMAFDSREQEAILMHETETSYICNGENITDKTNDKIYLLSIKELRTSCYGFWDEKVYWEHTIDKKINRRMRPTSYAQACGVWVYKHDSNKKWYIAKPDSSREGCCCWWTRSPCADTRYGTKMKNTKVTESGAIDKYDYGHILHRVGNAAAVVPVMHLDLERLTDIL